MDHVNMVRQQEDGGRQSLVRLHAGRNRIRAREMASRPKETQGYDHSVISITPLIYEATRASATSSKK
jgi:hypothetical protein